jgi:tellurite resistance-related uncharacterized protein
VQYKKIKVEEEGLKHGGIYCLEESCPFRRECANHTTAGDFRSEGGVTPRLSILNGQIGCNTIYADEDETITYQSIPVDHENTGALVLNDGNIELAEPFWE